MSVVTTVDMSSNINTTAESSKEKKKDDIKQIIGLLFLYGLGAILVVLLGLL